ncbi:hypothetical protein HDU98_004086 [Podochytrium sp. JEL0797]|nr:hypothetical protein HDU98_004086 [Podochytrium sp. JEL0797]
MYTMVAVFLTFAVSTIQWSLVGFSLSFSDTTRSAFIGNLDYFAQLGTMTKTNPEAPTIPSSLFSLYQMMFAGIGPPLFVGATAGRTRLVPTIIFSVLYSTFIYDPVNYWVWSADGWLNQLNGMDYAGGSVSHITAGTTAFVLAKMIGPRLEYGAKHFKPHSPTFVYIGTGLLWFGWMGFNGGSSVAANSRGVIAAFSTNLAASSGGITWMILNSMIDNKKFNAIGFCTGAVAGLAAITPGSGFVQPCVGIIYGITAAVGCFYAIKVQAWMKVDDTVDVAATHGVGGAIGMVLTGIFAQYQVSEMDNTSAPHAGLIDGVWVQVPVQILVVVCVSAWSAAWTALFVTLMNQFSVTALRCSAESEAIGLDLAEIGESVDSRASDLEDGGESDKHALLG